MRARAQPDYYRGGNRRMIELEENPYERVYKIDSQLTQLNEQLKTIHPQIGALELKKGGVYQVGKREGRRQSGNIGYRSTVRLGRCIKTKG